MIRRLKIENFFSFGEPQTLDLRIAANATDPDGRFATPSARPEVRLPRAAAIFGPNASGKTNLLRAFSFLLTFVKDSAQWRPDAKFPYLQFYGGTSPSQISRFSLELDGTLRGEVPLSFTQHPIVFRYDLALNWHDSEVLEETLKCYPQGRPRTLFTRERNVIHTGKDFRLPKGDPVRNKIRSNASVISTLAQFNHAFSLAIFSGLSALQTNVTVLGRYELPHTAATQYYQGVPDALDKLNGQIARFDFGIERIALEKGQNGLEPWFYHRGLNIPIAIAFESHGTQRFYAEFPKLYFVLNGGGVAIMDELDNDIHSLILPEIVRYFQDKRTNPYDAQLIMSCHNATLLEHLAKEEVFFTEKDDAGQTKIYGLKDVQGVRRDANIYAKYLSGAFGGVPILG